MHRTGSTERSRGGLLQYRDTTLLQKGRADADHQFPRPRRNTPDRSWHSVPYWPDHVTADEMVMAMDAVGVDARSSFPPLPPTYQYDGSYAVDVQQAHPGRFALVKPVNSDDAAVADVIADWKKTPGTVSTRIMMTKENKTN